MSESPQGGNGTGRKASDASSLETKERDAQLDAAIEATFPASDPVASFDFR
jgi:hypothetical protein